MPLKLIDTIAPSWARLTAHSLAGGTGVEPDAK